MVFLHNELVFHQEDYLGVAADWGNVFIEEGLNHVDCQVWQGVVNIQFAEVMNGCQIDAGNDIAKLCRYGQSHVV